MSTDPQLVRNWVRGFEEAAEIDREQLRATGPEVEWSIMTSLSLLHSAEGMIHRPIIDLQRERADASVREKWIILRRRLAPVR
ncbi:MAG: hypothetical protein NVSMB68_12660 [Thermoanaerobaculia bacterium]